jgi:hypothetical protein
VPARSVDHEGEIVRLGLPLRSAVAASAATGLLLTASACGSDPKEGPLAKKSDDPTASASPEAAPPAKPAMTDDAAGRRTFAHYVLDALTYAYETNDPSPITDVAADTATQHCRMCATFADYLANQKAKGQTLAGSSYPVKKIFDTGQVAKGVWVLDVVSDAPAYAQVDAAGTTIKHFPPQKGYVIEVGMTYDDGSYRLTGWKAGEQ